MAILCLETSGTNCSVAISLGAKILSVREENTKQFSHAEKLHVYIKEVLQEANIDAHAISAIAVSKGPGSYTGLRIGVSAAKGLCFAWEKPLIALPTLEVLAKQAEKLDVDFIIPLVDARRMEVYTAVYTNEVVEIEATKALVVEDNSAFLSYLEKGKVAFIGDGVTKCMHLLQHENSIFLEEKYPSSKELAVLAQAKLSKKEFEDVAYFEPFYLKDFMVTPSKK